MCLFNYVSEEEKWRIFGCVWIIAGFLARDNYSLPLIEDQLLILNNKKYFNRLDLKNGFFHMSMALESIKYTAFITPLSYHEYLKLPFGLKVGPARF